jgi:hypothetical protein
MYGRIAFVPEALPLAPRPIPGELISSWLLRVSSANGLTLASDARGSLVIITRRPSACQTVRSSKLPSAIGCSRDRTRACLKQFFIFSSIANTRSPQFHSASCSRNSCRSNNRTTSAVARAILRSLSRSCWKARVVRLPMSGVIPFDMAHAEPDGV